MARGRNWFEKINSLEKLGVCLSIGATAFFVARSYEVDGLTRVMLGWNAFSMCMIVMSWITFGITKSKEIRSQVKVQDPKRAVVFALILIATLASMLAVVLMILVKKEGHSTTNWRIPVAIAGMVLSWFLVHTVFALRYAHIYYGSDIKNPSTHAGGLIFPGEKHPEYFDFAYFSFVLGMTFQVSDVDITSAAFRKLAMFHGMISFAYNTVIIALVINLTV